MDAVVLSRRSFVKAGGALVVGVSALRVDRPSAAAAGPPDPAQADSYLTIHADNTASVKSGRVEIGQGSSTGLLLLVAEELDLDLDQLVFVRHDTSVTPNTGGTFGSSSIAIAGQMLRSACWSARQTLLSLASSRLGVPVSSLSVSRGVVSGGGGTVTYGELVDGRLLSVQLPAPLVRPGAPPSKPVSSYRLVGISRMHRLDIPAKVAGTYTYVHNVRVPGMLHGAVVRPPSVGATLAGIDEASVSGMPGVVKVVVRKNFVGVVAEKPWQAMQAAGKLKANWKPGSPLPPQRDFYDHLRRQPSRDGFVVNSGDVDAALAKAASVVKATYRHPYQMHGSMGTSCAVADVRNGKATVWSPTQSAYPTRAGVAALLGLQPDDVRVVFTRGAGCYGLNGADTVSFDAALLSQGVGRPVRVQLSRRDEMAWENYGFAYAIDQRIGVDANGTIVAWDYEAWFASRGGRPGYDRPGNVVTGTLAGLEPQPFRPAQAAEPSGEFRNGSNAAPSYVAGRVARKAGGAGTIASERVLTHTIASPFFTGPLRSPSRLQNTFAHECILDEVAAQVKADPVAYRLRHLSDPRLKAVVAAAAKAAAWDARPSPRPAAARSGMATGRGIACVAYEGDNGYVAMVAEVSVDRSTGRIVPTRFVVAQDCGPISNPDGMRNQIEGGALQGLSRALGEEVTWDDHAVTSVDWRTYHSLPLGMAVPAIESVLIDTHGVEAMGAGETAITVVAAAIGNAVFDATGVRLREVPFTPDRVRSAMNDGRPG